MADLRAPGKRDLKLPPIETNVATRGEYERALTAAVLKMARSYEWWIGSKYKTALAANPELAQDAAPRGGWANAKALFAELARLRKYWNDYFDGFAQTLAQGTFDSLLRDNSRTWSNRLKQAGFDISMQVTPSQRLILGAKVPENVSLIKSIAETYHKDVEGIVSRGFLRGRDLAGMADEIKARGKVTSNRAAFIARDQANKATTQMNDARQRELGIRYAVWQHSSAGKEPRPGHVRAGKEQWVYKVGEGIDFGDQFGLVLPGEAINCRCTGRSIIPALGRGDVTSDDDLEPVPGVPGAYRVRKDKSAGERQKMDASKTRV